jgi:hypothetical protein
MSFLNAFKPEIRRGSTRIVWVFPRLGFALKFPRIMVRQFCENIYFFRNHISMLWMYLSVPSVRATTSAYYHLLVGLVTNWNEFIYFLKHHKNTFLFPTYFSFFGLINITPLGKEINEDVSRGTLFRVLSQKTQGDACKDPHHFSAKQNFCIYRGNIRIRDYGGRETQKILLGHFPKLNALTSEDVT